MVWKKTWDLSVMLTLVRYWWCRKEEFPASPSMNPAGKEHIIAHTPVLLQPGAWYGDNESRFPDDPGRAAITGITPLLHLLHLPRFSVPSHLRQR